MSPAIEDTGLFSSTARKCRQVSSLISSCNKTPSRFVHPQGDAACIGDVPEEPRQWCAFEYADMMEQGRSSGPSTDFVKFMEIPKQEVRLCVELSADKRQLLLSSTKGESMMLARQHDEDGSFGIFFETEGETACDPAFRVTPNKAKDRWTLYAKSCDQCACQGRRNCGSRALAKIRHDVARIAKTPSSADEPMEEVGEARVHCMKVEVPEVTQEGLLDVWCPMCKKQTQNQECIELTSRRPKWCQKREALMLDFFGRCKLASGRNLMLELPTESQPEQSTPSQTYNLLFGRVGSNEYVLDFSGPLSMVQAFAIVVTTAGWK